MHKRHNPDTVIEAFGKGYSQAIEIDPNKRWLFTAGQVGAGWESLRALAAPVPSEGVFR